MRISQHKKIFNSSGYLRFTIGDYVRNFKINIREKEGRILNTNHEGEVSYMKGLLNNPRYTTFKSIAVFNDGIPYWNEQKVDYVPSNLRRGFIFYFICNGCERRAKHLYEYSTLESPLCRVCCRLKYEAPTYKARTFSRMLRKTYFSSEDKYLIIRRAGITLEDLNYYANTALNA